MPNYSIVANSKFQPFSYQELAAPIMELSNYHERLNDEYDKLSAQADVLEAMGVGDRDKNSESYNRYKAYSDSLRKEADNLYKFGLTIDSRRRLSDLRRMYNTDIVPIQNAWIKREKESETQQTAFLNNPSLMFTRIARDTPIDYYVNNPTGGYDVINGATITSQIAGMAKNLAKKIRNGEKVDIDQYTYNYILRNGLDENMIRNWENIPALKKMFNQAMEVNGVTDELLANSSNRDSILSRSKGYAEMGMWEAMGEDKSNILENFRSREQFKADLNLNNYREKKIFDAGNTLPIEDEPNVTSVDIGSQAKGGYKKEHLNALESLRVGSGLNANIFGSVVGKVNPIAIYEEYAREAKKGEETVIKNSKLSDYRSTLNLFGSSDSNLIEKIDNARLEARNKVLGKHPEVKGLLTAAQYRALRAAGYSNKKPVKKKDFDTLLNDFNKTVELRSAYTTNMTSPGYDAISKVIIPNLRGRKNNFGSTSWTITEAGTLGDVEDYDDLHIDNGNSKVTDVIYNPLTPGMIVLKFDDGLFHAVDPSIYDSGLKELITRWEGKRAKPQAITQLIVNYFRSRNKAQSSTDSRARGL